MSESIILQIPSGFLNVVNDAAIGMAATPQGTGVSPFGGQLGKYFDYDDSMLRFNSSVSTVYGGRFQYVRLSASAAAPVIGQILFWDTTVAANLYQVTTSETQTTDAAVQIAGIALSATVTPGNYTLIQVDGWVAIQFCGTLTTAGAIGSRCYAAALGGADLGFADVLGPATPTNFSDVSLMQARFLGVAKTAPTNGSLTVVSLQLQRMR